MGRRVRASAAAALGVAALAFGAVPAMAASANHSELPEPMTAGCTGQTTAFVAQGGEGLGVTGVGKVAMAINEEFGIEVAPSELHTDAAEYCTAELP